MRRARLAGRVAQTGGYVCHRVQRAGRAHQSHSKRCWRAASALEPLCAQRRPLVWPMAFKRSRCEHVLSVCCSCARCRSGFHAGSFRASTLCSDAADSAKKMVSLVVCTRPQRSIAYCRSTAINAKSCAVNATNLKYTVDFRVFYISCLKMGCAYSPFWLLQLYR